MSESASPEVFRVDSLICVAKPDMFLPVPYGGFVNVGRNLWQFAQIWKGVPGKPCE